MSDTVPAFSGGLTRRLFVQGSGATLASFALIAAGAQAATAAETLFLVAEGTAKAVIVVQGADPQLVFAADELVRVVEKATGVKLPRATGSAPSVPGVLRVYVGFAGEGADPAIQDKLRGLDPDGFAIAPYGDTLTILGPTPWGSRFGVLTLLDGQAKARWLMPTDAGEDIPSATSIAAPARVVRQSPSYTSRALYPADVDVEVMWAPRTEPSVWGDRNASHWRLSFHHNLYVIFDSYKFGASHPEWYPIINGKRYIPPSGTNVNWQPRFTAPGLAEEAARQAIAFFDANPAASSFSLGVTDGGGYSDEYVAGAGTNSVALSDMSPIYYAFVNKATELIMTQRPEFNDRYIGLLAYAYVNDPPPFALHPNVIPFLTRDRYGWVDPEIKALDQQHTLRWHAVAKQIGYYDYLYGNPYAIPRVPFAQMEEVLTWGSDNGVIAQMSEMVFNWGEGPKPWAYAHKLWNVSRPMRSLVREWCTRAAGPGGGYLEDYFKLWETVWLTKVPTTTFFEAGRKLTYFPFDDFSYLDCVTPSDISSAKRLLVSARGRANTAQRQARVDTIAREFELTEASALSYPRDLPAPSTARAARAMLDDVTQGLDTSVKFAEARKPIVDKLMAAGPLHNSRGPSFVDYGAVWSGWNCKTMLKLGAYIAEGKDGAASLRDRVQQLADTAASQEVRSYCAHLVLVADGRATHYGINPGFESGDLTGWGLTPNQRPSAPASVVTGAAYEGTHYLRIPGGFLTCGINEQAAVHRAGPGVWVTRFRYRVPSGSLAIGVFVPGLLTKDATGKVTGYRQDHYVPMSASRGEWVEAVYVDKLPADTFEVQTIGVAAYLGGNTEVHVDGFEFFYYGALGDGTVRGPS